MAQNQSIGALWINEAKSGKKYMSGVVELNEQKHNIVVFKNDNKKAEKHPDYRILLSQPKQQQQKSENIPTINQDLQEAEEDIQVDDIPF